MESVGSVRVKVCVLNNPGIRKKMHSVFEGFFFVPMCILRPNQTKWLDRRVIHFSVLVLDSKTNVPSST